MVEVGLAPGFVSALSGSHVYGALGATPVGTVPSGNPFPFAGVPNTPGSAVPARTPIQTAAPKTNVGIPYSRNVPSVFAQEPENLATASAGDPVFLSKKTPMLRGDTNRFTYVCTIEYLNKKLAGDGDEADKSNVWGNATFTTPTELKAAREGVLRKVHAEELQMLNDLAMETDAAAKNPDIDAAEKAALEAKLAETETAVIEAAKRHTADLAKAAFDSDLDFFALPALAEWRLDGILRSVDMDGTPLADHNRSQVAIVNTSDVSLSTLLNVVVQGPARLRLHNRVGYDEKWSYSPNVGTQTGISIQSRQLRVTVFDEMILALVKTKNADREDCYKVQRSTRSYEQERDKTTNLYTGNTRVVYQGVDEANMVGFWRLGRVLEEPNKLDSMAGINFQGGFVMLYTNQLGQRVEQIL